MNINMKIIVNFISICLVSILTISAYGQGIEVASIKANLNDGSAFRAPVDSKGNKCGLVKVKSNIKNINFEGEIIGEVKYDMNEYTIFMAKGANTLTIVPPNYLPISVQFPNYDITGIESKTTYVMTIKEKKNNMKKTEVVITVTPKDAVLKLDNFTLKNINKDGYYKLYLPKKTWICSAEAEGYETITRPLSSGKQKVDMNIELKSKWAFLDVSCYNKDADIYIDGIKQSQGEWQGKIISGTHTIETKLKYHKSERKTVTLRPEENRSVYINPLDRNTSTVVIKWLNNKAQAQVYLDGKKVGVTPLTLTGVKAGHHKLSFEAIYFLPETKELELDGQYVDVNVNLKFEDNRDYRYNPQEYMNKIYNFYAGKQETIKDELSQCLEASETSDIYGDYLLERKKTFKGYVFLFEKLNNKDYYLRKNIVWVSIYSIAGYPEQAEKILKNTKFMSISINDQLYSYRDLSYSFYSKGNWKKAIEYMTKYPLNNNYSDYNLLADCFQKLGDKKKAIEFYKITYLNDNSELPFVESFMKSAIELKKMGVDLKPLMEQKRQCAEH